MDAVLELRFLGCFQVLRDGCALPELESDRVRALLAYLAVERDRPHRRGALAGLLWPDEPEEVASHRLRQALTNLRAVLGDRDAAVPALLVSHADVQLNPAAAVRCDVVAFEELVHVCRAHPHQRAETCPACARRYEEAAALVRGPFLGGLSLRASDPFADWARARGEAIHEEACRLLEIVAGHHERRRAYGEAVRCARRALELEGWREAAHRSVMRGLTATGDRAGALRQFRVCERVLADELGIEPEPRTRALAGAIAAGAFPPRDEPPSALPRAHTRFVGRVDETARLLDLLPRERLITLAGPGGCGKTRLALRLAEEMAPDLPGRVWLVELDRVADGEQVPAAIAGALGLDRRAAGTPLERVAERLRGDEALLVLDNCEHLRGACARLVGGLLDECPALVVLATSREPLRVRGEVVWPLAPLSLPPLPLGEGGGEGVVERAAPGRPHPGLLPAGEGTIVGAVACADAVELFVDRVRRTRPDFALTADNAAAVAAICRRLEGMPLAIELAASWARVFAPERLLRDLDDQLALGTGEDTPARHRSLRDVVEWSHGLLGARERLLFRRLAVFVGGWTVEGAAAVCAFGEGADALAPGDVRQALAGLFDKSLVVPLGAPGDARYRFLETVRQLAAEKLAGAGEEALVRGRHAAWFVELAESAAPRLRGPEQATWLELLEQRQPNVRAALDELAVRGDAPLMLRLAAALSWFWHVHGDWREGHRQLLRALSLPGAALGTARARALGAAGLLAADLGLHDEAMRWAEEALSAARRAADRAGEAEALNVLGLAATERADEAGADECFRAALAVSETLGDRWGVGRALLNLGEGALRRGDMAAAGAMLGRAADELRAAGALAGVGVALGELARVACLEGSRAEARRLYGESLALHRRFGVRYRLVECLRGLAAIAADEGRTTEARALLEEALRTARDLGQPGAAGIAAELARLADGLVTAAL